VVTLVLSLVGVVSFGVFVLLAVITAALAFALKNTLGR
jgi:hypothetical protein